MPKRRFLRLTGARARAVAILMTVMVLTTGCGIGKLVTKTKQSFGSDLHIKVQVHSKLNLNSPVAVELVLFEDKNLLPLVKDLGAQDWFRAREQFFKDHKKGVTSYLWEWVPDQQVEEIVAKIKSGTKVGFVFASYISPGRHREQVDPRKHFTLRLGERDFEVVLDD